VIKAPPPLPHANAEQIVKIIADLGFATAGRFIYSELSMTNPQRN